MSGRYLVVFKNDAGDDKISQIAQEIGSAGGSVGNSFGSLLKGFSAEIPTAYLTQLQSLQGSVIDYIEPDQTITTQ